jgi:hypothetical protein
LDTSKPTFFPLSRKTTTTIVSVCISTHRPFLGHSHLLVER